MERIIEHIERLLLQHDCVIIPDFGGFVLQAIPAEYLEEEHLFTPANKEIVFNPTLTHNDGLLIESYMQHYSSDFSKAKMLVKKDVTEMRAHLDEDAELQFGSTGLFFKEDNRLIFMPAKHSDELFSSLCYGLPVFHFLPLSARDSVYVNSFAITASEQKTHVTTTGKTANRNKNVIFTIPVTRTFFQIVATTAAAILLFLFIATPVNDVNKASYSAGFALQELMSGRTADDLATFNNNLATEIRQEGNVTEAGTNNSDNISEVKSPILSDNTSTNNRTAATPAGTSKTPAGAPKPSTASSKATSASASASAPKSGSMKYYVIIASFKTSGQAQKYIDQQKGSETVTDAGIVVQDGRVRVYSRIFPSEKDAQAYTKRIRQNPKHAQAWISKGP